jgi:alginate O-acetyltransferase complex protein AlgI
MLFNSLEFLIFFIFVTGLYFALPHKYRWFLLLTASCFFYMFFKAVYILILGFTIVIDYYAGILIENEKDEKKKWRFLLLSVLANVGVLAIFKYYNFLNSQVSGLTTLFGLKNQIPYLNILLPIGLSFHTFQAMSYTMEVYRGNQKAERHFGIYALYVMFYPQLVAGPIERPQNMLHQFREPVVFSYENLISGLKRILWGLFKKVVIADRLAVMVDYVYKEPSQWHGMVLILASILFAFQIYCDFSGYSDIAIGTAKVMGIHLMENFNFPFRSKNITEFWRRWHISLSTWFRDYLFDPLLIKNRNSGRYGIILALLITFTVSGLWHGAAYTFIIFGFLHGLAIVVEMLLKKQRKRVSKKLPPIVYTRTSQFLTFAFLCVTWVFFRSSSLTQSLLVLKNMFTADKSGHFFDLVQYNIYGLPPTYLGLAKWQFLLSILLIPFLFICEWLLGNQSRNRFNSFPVYIRWSVYYAMILAILFIGVFDTRQFIYFQF